MRWADPSPRTNFTGKATYRGLSSLMVFSWGGLKTKYEHGLSKKRPS
jgi:hypothetical protein